MRKAVFLLIVLVFLAAVSYAAADTEYSLSPCSGSVTISEDKFIILTPDNLGEHTEVLTRIGRTSDQVRSDWEDRGVVLQAWFNNKQLDSCLEVIVRQDEDARNYYDLVNHSSDAGWKTFLASHKGDNAYKADGYDIKEVEKKQKNLEFHNFLLQLKYKRTTNDKTYWGYAFKTVAKGYTVVLDYQVYDRGLRTGDLNALNKIVNTLRFFEGGTETADTGYSGSVSLQITTPPPTETSSDTFTVEGRTVPGAHLIGVLMRINSAEPVLFHTDANARSGDFKLKVTLPEENVWLMTINVDMNDKIVAEQVFETTTYKKTLIPITFSSGIPEVLSADETVISGVTDKGVTIQCIVTNGTNTFDKTIKTNGTGKFNFKIPTQLEATYHFTVVFSKKGYDTKRFTGNAARNLNEEERKAAIKKEAIKPGYSTLCRNLESYIGKIMGYNLYIAEVMQNGNEWIIKAAMVKNSSGYKNFMYFVTSEDPAVEADSQMLMYGTCIGPYVIQTDEGNQNSPAFDLLFME
ncbi:MAG: hypothetical protein IJK06_06260 [Clostridia bacterium]|jgi:hypothetical protein|nr:hypothetical protein [Clostridia bacterium]